MIVDVSNEDDPPLLCFQTTTFFPCSYFDTSISGVKLTQRRGFHSCTGRRAKPLSRAVVVYEEEGVRVFARESGEACGRARALQSDSARPQCARARCSFFFFFFIFFFLAGVPSRVNGGNRVSESRSSLPGYWGRTADWTERTVGINDRQVAHSSLYVTHLGVREWKTITVGSVKPLSHWPNNRLSLPTISVWWQWERLTDLRQPTSNNPASDRVKIWL